MSRKFTGDAAEQKRLLVIGASAGGIKALVVLLPAFPVTCPLAVMIVLHVGRDGTDERLDLLRRNCQLPLREVLDKMPIEAGNVYLAPADYHVMVEADYHFALSRGERVQFSRPSIDVCFESVADVYGERATAILLTGANRDGSEGLQRMHARGARVIIQDPADAEFAAMPEAGLERVTPDQLLSLEGIAQWIAEETT
ncbi:MAG: two-component system chemotaxis response regulator CheB [Kiritimatiellia bacterium]|jgi:two-component system chemotaxis response regulator CheB